MADTAVDTTAAAEVTAKVGFIQRFFKKNKNKKLCVKMLREVLKSPIFFVTRTGFCDSICFPPFCRRWVTVSAT